MLFFSLAPVAESKVFLNSAIEFAVQFFGVGIVTLPDDGQKINKFTVVQLKQDLISIREQFESEVIEIEFRFEIEVPKAIILQLVELLKRREGVTLAAEDGDKLLLLFLEGNFLRYLHEVVSF